jgi:biotin operon repressor
MLPDVISTSGRLLRLVSLLSTRPSWTNGELAERMEVTERTVRRDIAKLRDLGYGIQSDPGPWGGYRLSGGAKVPLSLDDRCHPADQSEATPAVRHPPVLRLATNDFAGATPPARSRLGQRAGRCRSQMAGRQQ